LNLLFSGNTWSILNLKICLESPNYTIFLFTKGTFSKNDVQKTKILGKVKKRQNFPSSQKNLRKFSRKFSYSRKFSRKFSYSRKFSFSQQFPHVFSFSQTFSHQLSLPKNFRIDFRENLRYFRNFL
jgi:hypothetical protein